MFKDFWKDVDELHRLVLSLPKCKKTTYYIGRSYETETITYSTETGAVLNVTTSWCYVSET